MKTHDTKDVVLAPSSDLEIHDDLLSNVLRFVQLKGEAVFTTELGEGFNIEFATGSGCLHVVQEGQVELQIEGQSPITACVGDVLVFPHSVVYRLRDPMPPTGDQLGSLKLSADRISGRSVRHGHGTIRAGTISATFHFENRKANLPLIELLPNVIHIARDADHSSVLIRDVAQFLVVEITSHEPGATLMISRVIDILVIRCIRTWARSQDSRQGWIGALADGRISKAMAAVHRDVTRSWTVSDLASIAGMSRSRFSEVFQASVGTSPLRYLHRLRLMMASDLLKRSSLLVSETAHSVGYDSEAAFSRAYKAMFGRSPRESRSGEN